MPYKHETTHLLLPPSLDRRRKLTEEQKAQIVASSLSQRKLAAEFGVSRRLIQFLLNPAKLLVYRQRRAERGGWRPYYDRNDHASAVRDTRRYRQKNFDSLIAPPLQ
jgi:hypothetical protein